MKSLNHKPKPLFPYFHVMGLIVLFVTVALTSVPEVSAQQKRAAPVHKRLAEKPAARAQKAANKPRASGPQTDSQILCGGPAKFCVTWWRMVDGKISAQWKSRTQNSMSLGQMAISPTQFREELGVLRKIATAKGRKPSRAGKPCTFEVFIGWGDTYTKEACLSDFSASDQARVRQLLR